MSEERIDPESIVGLRERAERAEAKAEGYEKALREIHHATHEHDYYTDYLYDVANKALARAALTDTSEGEQG